MSDGLFSALDVSSSALAAQRRRMELLVTNMANSQTTRTPQGGPYQRKDIVLMSQPMQDFLDVFLEASQDQGLLEGVRVAEVVTSQSDPILKFEPSHPDADANGYVAYPNINPIEEMANLMAATRSFEANIKAFEAVKQIIQRSIEIGRRG